MPSGTICVIDDDPFVRTTICAALKVAGFEPVQAANGVEGIAAIKRTHARLAIVDIFMPEKEGFETIREINETLPHVKMLAISGGGKWSGPDDVLSMSRALGAHSYLAKPFRNEELVAKVTALLS